MLFALAVAAQRVLLFDLEEVVGAVVVEHPGFALTKFQALPVALCLDLFGMSAQYAQEL